ncbi:MAG: methyltransferase [Candidatus Caldarchaeum sp.]|nr:methyltransferase [Candidatus Caldarchaeum sp.]
MTRDQHFLVDRDVVRKIVEKAEVSRQDTVLDVGAGTGIITVEAARRAKLVIAVEQDTRLMPKLRAACTGLDNVKLVVGNILKTKLPPYTKVVSNPPFSIIEPLIMRHLRKPVPMSILVPKKFSDNIVAGNTALGFKTSLAYKAEAAEIFEGTVCQPPYPGKLTHLILNPLQKTAAEKAMLEFLSYSTSKTRNALRNIIWTFTNKRTATKIIELSYLQDSLLEKPVKRTTFKDLQTVYSFLQSTMGDKNLRINPSHNRPGEMAEVG